MRSMSQETDCQLSASSAPARGTASGTSRGTAAGIGAIVLWSFSGVCYSSGARAVGAMPYLCLTCAVGVLTIILLRLLRGRSALDLLRVPPRVALAGFFGVAL